MVIRDSEIDRQGHWCACDAVLVDDFMQFACIHAKAVLVAHIHRNRPILLNVSNILIHEGQRRVGFEFGLHFRNRNPILCKQVEIERRVLRVRRPGGRSSKLRDTKARRSGWSFRRRLQSGLFLFVCDRQFLHAVRWAGTTATIGDRQHGPIMYKAPKTSGCSMPMCEAP